MLGKGQVSELTEPEFYDLAAFMTPVRRRIGAWLGRNGFAAMRARLVALLDGWSDIGTADQRIGAFVASFPADREHRWVARSRRRGAALHRARALSADDALGVGRHGQYRRAARNLAQRRRCRAGHHRGRRRLRHLRDAARGAGRLPAGERRVPRPAFYVDLLCAQVYAGYINDRGGHYLRADFCGGAKDDPMAHTRRLLGLDAVDTESGRTRLKLIDGEAYVLGEPRQLSS